MLLVGVRCRDCGHPVAFERSWCPVCRGEVVEEEFGPEGVVWSATTVRIPTPGRRPPYHLAYVDIDDGPRVLAHVQGVDAPPHVGTRVRLVAPTGEGDLQVGVA